MLPRIVGLGRASELLYTGRALHGKEAHEWGFYNEICSPDALLERAVALACAIAQGPTAAHATTKRMLHDEWGLALDEAIDAEARAQAACMESNDFRRAYEAFVEMCIRDRCSSSAAPSRPKAITPFGERRSAGSARNRRLPTKSTNPALCSNPTRCRPQKRSPVDRHPCTTSERRLRNIEMRPS